MVASRSLLWVGGQTSNMANDIDDDKVVDSHRRAQVQKGSLLLRRLETLTAAMEKSSIAEYVEFYKRPLRVIYVNFLAGVARGFGIAVGVTILGAVVLYILQRSFIRNIPVIGSFIAEIVKIVEMELGRR